MTIELDVAWCAGVYLIIVRAVVVWNDICEVHALKREKLSLCGAVLICQVKIPALVLETQSAGDAVLVPHSPDTWATRSCSQSVRQHLDRA